MALPEYTRLRSAMADDGAALAAAADRVTLLGMRLDRARSDMAAAYTRDRRTAARSYRAHTSSV